MPGLMLLSRLEAHFTAQVLGFCGSSSIGDIPDKVHVLL